jgi:hypothetical protein
MLMNIENINLKRFCDLMHYRLEDDANNDNLPRLILSQFRLLDQIVNSGKLADKILEVMEPCTRSLKKEIVSYIPEIIDDSQHGVGIFLKSDSHFTARC